MGAAASGQKLAVWPEAPNVYEKFIRVDPARIHCPIPPTQSLDNSHEYSSFDKQKWGNIFVYLHLLWLVVTFARLRQVGWVVLDMLSNIAKIKTNPRIDFNLTWFGRLLFKTAWSQGTVGVHYVKLFPRDGRSNKEQHSLCEEEKTVIFFHWKRKAALSKTSYPCLYPFVVPPAKITLFLTSNSFPCGSFIAVTSANFHSSDLFKNVRFLYICLLTGRNIPKVFVCTKSQL